MSDDRLFKSKLHKQVAVWCRLSQRNISWILLICLLNIVVNKQGLNEEILNRLEVSKWIILILRAVNTVWRVILLLRYALIVFACTFFKENFAQHFLFLLVRIIILDIVIAGCIKHRIVIVITIRVSVSHLLINRLSLLLILRACHWYAININLARLILNLRCQQKHSFVEATYHRNLDSLLSVSSRLAICGCHRIVALTLLFRRLLSGSTISCSNSPRG